MRTPSVEFRDDTTRIVSGFDFRLHVEARRPPHGGTRMTSLLSKTSATITEHEAQQVERANLTGRQPVVFVHGLWLLPSSWDRWAKVFETAGYATVTPSWPDDPDTVEQARANPGVFAKKTIGQITDHTAEVIGGLERKPAIIGHSFGGAFTQMMAGRGLSAASVAIDPAPFRGILPLPISTLRSAMPV